MSQKIKCRLKVLFILVLAVGCTTSSNTERRLSTTNNGGVMRYPIKRPQLETFKDSIRPIQGELKAKYDLARHFQRIQRHRIAIEILKEIIAMDPTYADAHNATGFSYDCRGDYQTARHHYRTAIAINPEMDHAYNNLGYSYMLDGNYALAVKALKQAITLNDGIEKYHKNLGLAYYKNGEIEMALFEFRKIEDTAIIEKIMIRLGMLPGMDFVGDVDTTKPLQSDTIQFKQRNRQDRQPAGNVLAAEGGIDIKAPLDSSPEVTSAFGFSKPMSAQTDGARKIITEDIPPDDNHHLVAKIEVSNGNGVRRMARNVGHYLKGNGIKVSRLTNADHFDHDKTVIYYRENFYDEASRINNLLQKFSKQGHLIESSLVRDPIRVLIGKDLVPFKDHFMPPVNVDVSNGNGVNGMARRLGKYLAKEGFRVGRLTNADHFSYHNTVVFVSKGRVKDAKVVADTLPGNGRKRIVELKNSGNRVQVRLGADMVF